MASSSRYMREKRREAFRCLLLAYRAGLVYGTTKSSAREVKDAALAVLAGQFPMITIGVSSPRGKGRPERFLYVKVRKHYRRWRKRHGA
jgi:hypothetical protein